MLWTVLSGSLAAAGVICSCAWIWLLAGMLRYRSRVPKLADLPAAVPTGGWPSLAVIFAARNEAENVERAVQSLLSQDYPSLEVTAVDDRSTDATGEILDRLAAGHSSLRVVHVHELPSAWLGKNHALDLGAKSTSAEWLLFTDADVVFAQQALRKAMAFGAACGADHVVVLPEVPAEGFGEGLFLAMFVSLFSFYSPLEAVEKRESKAHLGIGAFNLVRASALAALGGFRNLSLSVDDDMRLGQALKAAGFQPRVLIGSGAVSVRWQVGLAGMIRGLEKNFFAAAEFRLWLALLYVALFFLLGAAPHAGLLFGPWWTRILCGAGVAAMCACVQQAGRESDLRWYYGLTMPISAALIDIAMLRSIGLTLFRGGVRWRDHHYPLSELRHHVRERNAWVRKLWSDR